MFIAKISYKEEKNAHIQKIEYKDENGGENIDKSNVLPSDANSCIFGMQSVQ